MTPRPGTGYDAGMPGRVPPLATIACACALLSPACAKPKDEPTPPSAGTDASGGSASSPAGGSTSTCLPGGPSVAVTVQGRAGGDDLPGDELGALLQWIGGFAQPCRQAPSEAHHFTLELGLGAAGQPPTLALVERASLPSLAACLDDTFAKAPPPPPGPMTVRITIPWGCSTLGPGFQADPAPTP